MDDHWQVIEDALQFKRAALNMSPYWDEHRGHDAMTLDATLAFVREMRMPQEGGRWMPLPDGFYLDSALAIAYNGKDIGLKVSDEDYGDDWAGNYEWLSDCEIRDMRAKDENYRLCRWQEGE